MPRRKRRWIEAELAAQAAKTKTPAQQPASEPWPQNMSLRQAGRYLGHKSHYILYRWAQAGKLAVDKTTKSWTVSKTDLDELWREGAETAA